tara:strand:+ start:205 stop:960 length:756 start_codon:yes stop_codon:yes gene_type:complete
LEVNRGLGISTSGYEIIIVGGGIVGSEAAFVCASKGIKTLLVTTSLDSVYALGARVGQLKPAPDTLMANLLDGNMGASQPDGAVLRVKAKYILESLESLHLLQSNVTDLIWTETRLGGVVTWEGVVRFAPRVALCVGSFLKARLSSGSVIEVAGRLSEMAYDDLFLNLIKYGYAFENTSVEFPKECGALPYTVTFQRFGLHELGQDGFTLKRTPGLYSAGVCVDGELPHEIAANTGRKLGITLASAMNEEG